jgi:hypothetical protein
MCGVCAVGLSVAVAEVIRLYGETNLVGPSHQASCDDKLVVLATVTSCSLGITGLRLYMDLHHCAHQAHNIKGV